MPNPYLFDSDWDYYDSLDPYRSEEEASVEEMARRQADAEEAAGT